MSAPEQTSGLLEEARTLAAAREWEALVRLLDAVPDERLSREPELAFLLADGLGRIGESTRAIAVAELALAGASRRADARLARRVLNVLGIALFSTGEMSRAEDMFTELLARSSDAGDEVFVARAANNLGAIENVRGRRERAMLNYQRALAGYAREGNERGLAQTHYNLGISFRDLAFDGDADAHFQRATDYANASLAEDVVALAEVERANLRVRWGDGRLGAEMARRALDRFRRISDPTGAAQAIRVLGLAALAEGRRDEAAQRLDEALEIADAHADALLRAEVQRDRGVLLRTSGDPGGARRAFELAAAEYETIGSIAEATAIRILVAEL